MLSLLSLGLLTGLTYYIVSTSGFFTVPCVFYQVSSLYCPGCGMTRMMTALIQRHYKEAFFYHPIALIGLPILSILLIKSIYRYIVVGKALFSKVENIILWLLVISLVLFNSIRNIPQIINFISR